MTSSQHRRLASISKIALLLSLIVISPTITTAQVWTVLTFDGKGDGRDPSLADAAQLAYRYDKPGCPSKLVSKNLAGRSGGRPPSS